MHFRAPVPRRGVVRITHLVALVLPLASGVARASGGPPPLVRFHDAGAQLSLAYPRGWHLRRALINLVYPRERLVLASYPLPRHDSEGECEPKRSLAQMPPDGAFLSLLEYRPQTRAAKGSSCSLITGSGRRVRSPRFGSTKAACSGATGQRAPPIKR